jgi:hypothetical protein
MCYAQGLRNDLNFDSRKIACKRSGYSDRRSRSYIAFDANLGEEAAVVRSLVEAPEEGDDSIVFHKQFMALPKDDRFFIADSTGRKIDGSDGWSDIKPCRESHAALLTFRSQTRNTVRLSCRSSLW